MICTAAGLRVAMGEFLGTGIRNSQNKGEGQESSVGQTPEAASQVWPTSVQELTDGERLVIWAFRRWIAGPDHLPMLAREFDRQFRRAESRQALIALDLAMSLLTRHARRTIVHHQACCPCLAADEVCMISIVAALQNGADAAARAMAPWLLRSDGVPAFLSALDDLAECLTGSGHDLPYRTRPRASGHANAAAGGRDLLRPVAQIH